MTAQPAKIISPSAKPRNPIQTLVDWRVFYSATGGALRVMQEILPRVADQHEVSVGYLCRARKNEPPKVSHGFDANLPFPFSFFPEGPIKEACWKKRLAGMENTVFHSPYYTACPADLPTVATIHDLITEIFVEQSADPYFDRLRAQKAHLIRNASRLIAISKSTINDLTRLFGISPDRVDLIPHGVDSAFFSAKPTEEELASLQPRLPSAPFLLIVGGRDAHKNFLRFVDAYAGSNLKKDFEVVVTGEVWTSEELRRFETPSLAKRFHNVGKVTDAGLRVLYHRAAALVYPSSYEGFGLPALEALAAGTPLAVSNASSLPEVVGDCGFQFPPDDVSEMTKQIRNATDAGRNSPQVKNGQARARQFTWDETARLTALSYRKALLR